jgi:hypothetical protein
MDVTDLPDLAIHTVLAKGGPEEMRLALKRVWGSYKVPQEFTSELHRQLTPITLTACSSVASDFNRSTPYLKVCLPHGRGGGNTTPLLGWWDETALERLRCIPSTQITRVTFDVYVPGYAGVLSDVVGETPVFPLRLLSRTVDRFPSVDDVSLTVYTFSKATDPNSVEWRPVPTDHLPIFTAVRKLTLTLVFTTGHDSTDSLTRNVQGWLEYAVRAFPGVQELKLNTCEVWRDDSSEESRFEVSNLDLGVRFAKALPELRVLSVDTATRGRSIFVGISGLRGLLRTCSVLRELDFRHARVLRSVNEDYNDPTGHEDYYDNEYEPDELWSPRFEGSSSLHVLFLGVVREDYVRRWSNVIVNCPNLEHVGVTDLDWGGSSDSYECRTLINRLKTWPFSEAVHTSSVTGWKRPLSLRLERPYIDAMTLSTLLGEVPCIHGAAMNLCFRLLEGDLFDLARPLPGVFYLDLRRWMHWNPMDYGARTAELATWVSEYFPDLRALCLKAKVVHQSPWRLDVARHMRLPGHEGGVQFVGELQGHLTASSVRYARRRVGVSLQVCKCGADTSDCACAFVHMH